MTVSAAPPPARPTGVMMQAWLGTGDDEERTFDDRRLLDYRHPHEWLALIVALLPVVLIVPALAVVMSTAGGLGRTLVFGLVAAWVGVLLSTWLQLAGMLGQAVEVTPTQFRQVYTIVSELRQRFGMPRTRVFVLQSPSINAFSFGLVEPYGVVLHSALVEAMDELELQSVIGHEFGHIKFGHTRLGILFGQLPDAVLPLPFPFGLIRAALSLWWGRTQEFSADRAGVVACRRPSKAVAAQVKLSVGGRLFGEVDIDQLARQASDLHTGWMHLGGFLAEARANHPLILNRIQAILKFAEQAGSRGPVAAARSTSGHRAVASLSVRHGPDAGRVFPIDTASVTGGRGADNRIRLADEVASRRHFRLHREPDGWWIDDLQSSNGTFVNQVRIDGTQRLRDGDTIRAGGTHLEFREPA